ncbi:hypothetical protein V2J09_004451 [Rumex salicifolius]
MSWLDFTGRRPMCSTCPSFVLTIYSSLSVLMGSPQENFCRRPFHFQAMWHSHPTFNDVLIENWRKEDSLPNALVFLKKQLQLWNKMVLAMCMRERSAFFARLRTPKCKVPRLNLQAKLNTTLEQKELIWFQKSRQHWLACGDRNTKFFHMSTIIRLHMNKIKNLKLHDDSWCLDQRILERHARGFFSSLYALEVLDDVIPLDRGCFLELSFASIMHMVIEFNPKENETAVRDMAAFKASGTDGFQPVFFQQLWANVGPSLVSMVLDFFKTCRLPPDTNETLLVLITKINKPSKIEQFRPINLLNVYYKTITKGQRKSASFPGGSFLTTRFLSKRRCIP